MKTTRYHDVNGTSIPLNTSYVTNSGYRCCPDNKENLVDSLGYLYNWTAATNGGSVDGKGLCPNGWHIPSDEEWEQLTDYVKSRSDYICGGNNTKIAKALCSPMSWNSNNTACAVGNDMPSNNATGFSAVAAGMRGGENGFHYYRTQGFYWSRDANNAYAANTTRFISTYATVLTTSYNKGYYFSVRCLKN